MGTSKPDIVKGNPAESERQREFIDGSIRGVALLRSAAIGMGTYNPGWRWSQHAGAQTGKDSGNHIGYVISGKMMVRDAAGNEMEIGPGEAFEAGPDHDAWVVGEQPCVAIDFAPVAK
jgi:hypothetical protein